MCLLSSAQKHEVRAVWLATIGGIDWPRSHNAAEQRREMIRTLDMLKAAGINTVLLQTRVRASTIYPSAIEPWDACLTGSHGRAPGYDPLQFCIDECHRRGMELHAWIVTIPVGKLTEARCKEFQRRNPQLFSKVGDSGYMNPENPRTGDYLARICQEVTRNYDIDGIHLDYIRYPETWKLKVSRAQGRQNITSIVRKIHQAVKQEKPWVKLSCSPIGKHGDLTRYRSGGWNAYNAVCQHAQEWMREGLMDQLYPMQYFRGNNYFPFLLDWQEQSADCGIVSGLGIYFLDPREGKWTLDDVRQQMFFCREVGAGHSFFRSKFLTDNTKGIYDFTRHFNRLPALPHPLKATGKAAPEAPAGLQLRNGQLSWPAAVNNNDSPYLLYNVYASRDYPVDTSCPENLVGWRLRATSVSVKPAPGLYYAVCAVDRYGQESSPRQMDDEKTRALMGATARRIELTDGQWLVMPPKDQALDAKYAAIETLHGQLVMTIAYQEQQRINIAHLPEGIYQLRSLGHKGTHHRIGFFAIKRR